MIENYRQGGKGYWGGKDLFFVDAEEYL